MSAIVRLNDRVRSFGVRLLPLMAAHFRRARPRKIGCSVGVWEMVQVGRLWCEAGA